jgi:hypothetical protein
MHRFVSALALSLLACAGAGPPTAFDALIGSPGVVTLTNLHPDERRSRLFAVNYQQEGLIPLCSAVALLDRDGERLVFTVQQTGRTDEYYHHAKAAAEPFPEHLSRYFGTECPRDEALAEIDRQGIAQGKALAGMWPSSSATGA